MNIPPDIAAVLEEPTSLSSKGFPILTELAFQRFRSIPHLFEAGSALLDLAQKELTNEADLSRQRAWKVISQIIRTAAVTAPSDLWLLRHLIRDHLSIHQFAELDAGVTSQDIAAKYGLDHQLLQADLAFFVSRGLLEKYGHEFRSASRLKAVLEQAGRSEDLSRNLIPAVESALEGTSPSKLWADVRSEDEPRSWHPSWRQMEIGARLVPSILALRMRSMLQARQKGTMFEPQSLTPCLTKLFQDAGLLSNASEITLLGERVFARAPGPFGIIHAYHPYLATHKERLTRSSAKVWVARGENVAASQDANRRSFASAHEKLQSFCEDFDFEFDLFIEHAVGQGEASRQAFARHGDKISYFGADLESEAVRSAMQDDNKADLPKNMRFASGLDIGKPKHLIEVIKSRGISYSNVVMMVGNGFHEIRNQTNESMVEVFRGYCEAGFVLIFTEETGLRDSDLLETAWNTYHAGFRYAHAISGQGLRPAYDTADETDRYSWRKCAALGGYEVLDQYGVRTRKIFPHPRDGYNPSVSETYFCVPSEIYAKLKDKPA